jgi:hypothetical protein
MSQGELRPQHSKRLNAFHGMADLRFFRNKSRMPQFYVPLRLQNERRIPCRPSGASP